MTTSRSDLYATDNFALAAFLWFRGYHIEEMIWEQVRGDAEPFWRCSWYFVPVEALAMDVEAFNNGDARVNPKTFFDEMKSFNRKVYAERDRVMAKRGTSGG